MRKKTPAGPCRTLGAEQRAEVERQLRAEGRLRAADEAQLAKLRRRKAMQETAARNAVTGSHT
jgi:hypothetical protein